MSEEDISESINNETENNETENENNETINNETAKDRSLSQSISIDSSQGQSENLKKYLDEYYKLKNRYETNNQKEIRKILNNQDLSWKEKRSKYQRIVPKCVVCKQSGGTIFSTKYIEATKNRSLKARCGNKASPCSLNILLNTGKYISAPKYITEIEGINKELKDILIRDKNNLMFGYMKTDEVLENFESLKADITRNYVELETCIREYYNVIDNPDDNKKIIELTEKSFAKINSIKDSIKQFNDEDNTQYVADAVEVYINELMPIVKELMGLKYRSNIVWYNEDTGTYHLLQSKTAIKDIELDIVEAEVIAFNTSLEIKQPYEDDERGEF